MLTELVALTQQIESALASGRDQCNRLRVQISSMQARHQQAIQDLDRKLHESQAREQQLNQTLGANQLAHSRKETMLQGELKAQRDRAEAMKTEINGLRETHESFQARIAQLQGTVAQLQDACAKRANEVELYKASWTQVLQMDRAARAYLKSKNETEAKIHTLETRNLELLNEAKTRIRALETSCQSLQTELEKAKKEALQERTNAASALRAAEEERNRCVQAQAEASELQQRITHLEGKAASPAVAGGADGPQIEIQVGDLTEEFERIVRPHSPRGRTRRTQSPARQSRERHE